jgi:hypothetical protein
VSLHRERRNVARFAQEIGEPVRRLNAVVKLRDICREFELDGGSLREPRVAHVERRGDLRALLAPYVDIQARAEPDDAFRCTTAPSAPAPARSQRTDRESRATKHAAD